MSYDVNQSKTALETGINEVPLWVLQDTTAVQWDENEFFLQGLDKAIC